MRKVTALLIINLVTRWRRVVSFRLRPLCPSERKSISIKKRLGGPQSR